MYKITIEGLKPKQLLSVLDSLPSSVSIQVTNSEKYESGWVDPRKNGHSQPTDLMLSLTGKKAAKGSIREKVLQALERMEKKHGVGTVDRKALKKQCDKTGIDAQILYQLIRGDYIKEG